MTDAKIPVTEDELHAYVDGELPAERRIDVETWLATHPDDAERVKAWRDIAEALHARYGYVADESVPKRLELERLDRRPRRLMYGAVAALLAAFIGGSGIGWVARTATATPSPIESMTSDALDAHRLYVVEVRHPVEVLGNERDHLQSWLTRRCGWDVRAPNLDASGLQLVGGRLLPGPTGPASFFMYESASGERYTLYASRSKTGTVQMRYTAAENSGAMYWSEDNVSYVLIGPTDKERLNQVARRVYDQNEKGG